MSLFFRRSEQRSSSGDWSDLSWSGGRLASPEKATYLTPVFSALRHIVDFVSTLPVDAYRRDESGKSTQLKTLPLLLRSQDEIGRAGLDQWFGQAAYALAVDGNAVGWVLEVDGFGHPTLVRWLKRHDWSYDETGRQWYIGGLPVPPSRVFHVPWIVPNGRVIGLSPIEHYAAITQAGLSAQEYADVRRGGGIPPTHLKNNRKTLDTKQAERVRESARSAFATGDPFVTGADWDLTINSIPPSHAKFIETLKLSANQIAAIYGIDPREIGGEAGESLTYSTDESRSLNRANNMRPYIVRLENAINRNLPDRQFMKLNVDSTIRTDAKTRTDLLGQQIQDGRLSVNEARELEDRPPVDGGNFHNVPAPAAEPTNRQGETS